MSGHIYVCHSQRDNEYVERVVEHLVEAGLNVAHGLKEPAHVIRNCAVFIVVLSRSSATSVPINREIDLAARMRKPIIPLVLESGSTALAIRNLFHHDVTDQQMPSADLIAKLRVLTSTDPVGGTRGFETGVQPTPRMRQRTDESDTLERLPTVRKAQPVAPPPGVFVCYRRDDSAGSAGRMRDGLVAQFGEAQVFFDTESIDGGRDFVDATLTGVRVAKVVLVVIGRHWLTVLGEDGTPRLTATDDLVRREIETALALEKRIIPVLVDGAVMPSDARLPESIRSLSRRNAVSLDHVRFRDGLTNLVRLIGRN